MARLDVDSSQDLPLRQMAPKIIVGQEPETASQKRLACSAW